MSATQQAPGRPGVGVGPTTEFTLFFKVLTGHADALRSALADLQHHLW